MMDPERHLGYLVDDEDGEYDSQEEMNVLNLYLYDQDCFLNLLKHHISRYTLDEYIGQFPEENKELWEKAFQVIIKEYSLNNLKTYQTEVKIANFEKHVIDLIQDIKVRMQDDILEKRINQEFTIDELDVYLRENKYHLLLKWSIKFLDIFSYKRFIKKIFEESASAFHNSEDLKAE